MQNTLRKKETNVYKNEQFFYITTKLLLNYYLFNWASKSRTIM